MIRRIFIALVILVVATPLLYKAAVAIEVYRLVGSLQHKYASDMDLRYEWINSDFDGGISLKNFSVTPFKLKRTYTISRLHVRAKDPVDLVKTLYSLESGHLPAMLDIYAENIISPLQGRDPEEWLELNGAAAYLTPFRVYRCTTSERIGHDELRSMGIKKLRMNLSIKYQVSSGEQLKSDIVLDANEMGRYEIKADWRGSNLSTLQGLGSLKLQSANVSLTDAGYFRRLGNFCADLKGLSREEFVAQSTQAWSLRLSEMGITPSENLRILYHDFLLGGGVLDLSFSLPAHNKLLNWFSWKGQDVMSLYSIKLAFNGNSLASPMMLVDGQKLRSYLHPDSGKKSSLILSEPGNAKNRPVPQFSPVEWNDLKGKMGYRVRVKTHQGKIFEGRLAFINEYRLEIQNELVEGTVAYQIKRDELQQALVWDRAED